MVKLTDGLGNQMFQYAYGRWLQDTYGEKYLYLDVTKLGGKHLRAFGLSHFKLNCNVVIPPKLVQFIARLYVKVLLNLFYRVFRISTKTEKGVKIFAKCGLYTNSDYYRFFPSVKTCLPIKFVRGFFQNESYFVSIKDAIREEFTLKQLKYTAEQEEMFDKIRCSNSVCVHVRRGDFVNSKRFEVCTKSYFQRAIDYITSMVENPTFFLFSNTKEDVDWIREHYQLKGNIVYVGVNNDEYSDFVMMMSCNHFAISNSTFSWWAAYLSVSRKKIVVAPRPWVNSEIYQEGIYCKGWHVIDAVE